MFNIPMVHQCDPIQQIQTRNQEEPLHPCKLSETLAKGRKRQKNVRMRDRGVTLNKDDAQWDPLSLPTTNFMITIKDTVTHG